MPCDQAWAGTEGVTGCGESTPVLAVIGRSRGRRDPVVHSETCDARAHTATATFSVDAVLTALKPLTGMTVCGCACCGLISGSSCTDTLQQCYMIGIFGMRSGRHCILSSSHRSRYCLAPAVPRCPGSMLHALSFETNLVSANRVCT